MSGFKSGRSIRRRFFMSVPGPSTMSTNINNNNIINNDGLFSLQISASYNHIRTFISTLKRPKFDKLIRDASQDLKTTLPIIQQNHQLLFQRVGCVYTSHLRRCWGDHVSRRVANVSRGLAAGLLNR